MSRFPAELTVTLVDGRTVTECFNQEQMALVMHEAMLDSLRKGESIVVFDGERLEIPAAHVDNVRVVVHEPAL